MRVEQAQIEVARDAWQEDEGRSERWRVMLKEHPRPVQEYIRKRFEKERDDLKAEPSAYPEHERSPQRFRITSLEYQPSAGFGSYDITDNTPGF